MHCWTHSEYKCYFHIKRYFSKVFVTLSKFWIPTRSVCVWDILVIFCLECSLWRREEETQTLLSNHVPPPLTYEWMLCQSDGLVHMYWLREYIACLSWRSSLIIKYGALTAKAEGVTAGWETQTGLRCELYCKLSHQHNIPLKGIPVLAGRVFGSVKTWKDKSMIK